MKPFQGICGRIVAVTRVTVPAVTVTVCLCFYVSMCLCVCLFVCGVGLASHAAPNWMSPIARLVGGFVGFIYER